MPGVRSKEPRHPPDGTRDRPSHPLPPHLARPAGTTGVPPLSVMQRLAGNRAVAERRGDVRLPDLQNQTLSNPIVGVATEYSRTIHTPEVAPLRGVVPGMFVQPSLSVEVRAKGNADAAGALTLNERNELSAALDTKVGGIALGLSPTGPSLAVSLGAEISPTSTTIDFDGLDGFTVHTAAEVPSLHVKLRSGKTITLEASLDLSATFTPDSETLKSVGKDVLMGISAVLLAILVILLLPEELILAAVLWLGRLLVSLAL